MSVNTMVVASHSFMAVDQFVSRNANVELQIEPSLVYGDIKSMSLDCIKRLYRRFDTPYVLIVQDDGFPLRPGLEAFVGKIDYYGAPIISDGCLLSERSSDIKTGLGAGPGERS